MNSEELVELTVVAQRAGVRMAHIAEILAPTESNVVGETRA